MNESLTEREKANRDNRNYRKRHPEKSRESSRKWREKNLKYSRFLTRTAAKNQYEREPEVIQERARMQRLNNPEKAKARDAVNHAVRDGRLIKEDCCLCGNPKTDAHHEDYGKPLDVIWLCKAHHKQLHILRLKQEEGE
jgi:hypothetical protein